MWLRLNTTAVYKCVHMFYSLYQVRAGNLHIYICVWEWEWERRAWKSAFSLWLWIFLFLVPFKCLYVVATYLTIQNTFVRLKYTQTQRAETEFSLRIQIVCVFFALLVLVYGLMPTTRAHCNGKRSGNSNSTTSSSWNTCEFSRIRASSVWWLCMCTVYC